MSRETGVEHIAFLFAVGLAGWLTVVGLSLWPTERFAPWDLNAELYICLFLATVARLLAFRGFRGVRIALDSAFYVAAAFVCGVIPASALVLATLTLDSLVRHASGIGGYLTFRRGHRVFVIAQVVYKGGLPALVLLAVGAIFGDHQLRSLDDLGVAWALPVYAIAFLLLHYALTGGGHLLEGATRTAKLGGSMLRLVGAECVLVPMSLAMVLGYRHQGLGLFLLIGTTGLLMNAIFKRVVTLGEQFHRRAEELATLNEVGRIIAASLERDVLMRNLASATLHLVRHTSRFMIGLFDETEGMLKCQLFDESGARYSDVDIKPGDGLPGWVFTNRKPLLLGDLDVQASRYTRDRPLYEDRFNSWLGLPLLVYDEVMGVMAVQTVEHDAYTPADLRVLTTIADQAGVAFENARLYELATVDGLTGLFVRRYFDHRVREEWDRAMRYGGPFAVVMFDLDNFKGLNDRYGHQVGDQVLRTAASVVRENMRSFDIPTRYGGEEFAFILPRTELDEAARVAERIRADVASRGIDTPGGELRVTASLGLAASTDLRVNNVDELIARADEALYQAKKLGKNRVEVFGEVSSASDGPAVPRVEGL